MTIENPAETVKLIEASDALTTQLKEATAKIAELELMKTEFETNKASLVELTKEVETLRVENVELKEAAGAYEEVGEQIAAETAKTVELTGQLDIAKTTYETELAAKDKTILEFQERAEAFEALADEYAEEKEAVQDQVALIISKLTPKALVPDLEEVVDKDEAPASYKTWLKLSLSQNPEDRRMARRMQKDNPEISEFSHRQSNSDLVTPATTSFTAEQIQIFASWKALRAEAQANIKNHTIHATKIKEARRLYKENQPIMDAQINAEQSA